MSDFASDLWPRTPGELRARFKNDNFPRSRWPAGRQSELLLSLLGLYESKGLSPASSALCDCCENRRPCWHGGGRTAKRRPTADDTEDGGIILPWVGKNYLHRHKRVVLVALNPNIARGDPTELLLEHSISWFRHQDRVFGPEVEYDGHSPFAFRAYQSLAAVVAHADALPIPNRATFPELRETLHQTARLQAVKCIPRVSISKPEREMRRRCPDFLLVDELTILAPDYILGLGGAVRAAFESMDSYRTERTHPKNLLTVGSWNLGRISAIVFLIPHPSPPSRNWEPGDRELREYLR